MHMYGVPPPSTMPQQQQPTPPARVPDDWIFEKEDLEHSPSIRAGMSLELEMQEKRKGIEIIIKTGTDLRLRFNPTLATACTFFHRFFAVHSLQEFNYGTTALACLFLAGKTEETPKKCRDVAQTAAKLFREKFAHIAFNILLEEIMAMERVLLQTIRFEFTVDLPYDYVKTYAGDWRDRMTKETVGTIVRTAWTLMNDSYYTNLCLLWEPQISAIAYFYLAAKMTANDDNDMTDEMMAAINESWWEQYVRHLDANMCEEICHLVLDYYSEMKGNAQNE